MRPLHLADVECATRVLAKVAPLARRDVMAALIAQACQADRYRLAHGRPHPVFGTGSLMSSALCMPMGPRPAALGVDELDALGQAAAALAAHLAHQSP